MFKKWLLVQHSQTQTLLVTASILIAALAIGLVTQAVFLPTSGVLLIFQLALILVAIVAPRTLSLIACFTCALLFNYFFTAPLFSFHMSQVDDVANMVVFILVALITREVSDRFRQQHEALRQAETRSNILMSVSHDLRTPIAAIIGSLSALQNYKTKISTEEQASLINESLNETHRLHRYIENLLQATKLKQQGYSLNTLAQPIWPLLENVAKRSKSERVHLVRSTQLNTVTAHGELLEQAIFNLVENALFYSPKDKPVVIEAETTASATKLRVKDYGSGIPLAHREQVFELFYSSRTGDQGVGGSGIGLTVSKSIVDAHNGTIQVLNTAQGCCIEITLPNDDK